MQDLWILDKKEKPIIIEVKSMNKNLTRQDIPKLDEHREAREMPNLTGLRARMIGQKGWLTFQNDKIKILS